MPSAEPGVLTTFRTDREALAQAAEEDGLTVSELTRIAVADFLERRRQAEPALPSLALLSARGKLRTLEELELEAITFAIEHCRDNMSLVAQSLGIGRSTQLP